MATPHGIHSRLVLQRVGPLVLIQPSSADKQSGASLAVDLNSGSIGLSEHNLPLSQQKGSTVILGVIGVLRLKQSSALAVITGAKQVATVRGYPAYKVTDTQVLTNGSVSANRDDARFAELLRTALTPAGAGDGLYFSYNTNLTMSQQRYASSQLSSSQASRPAWAAAEPQFFWNRHIALPLLEGGVPAEVARFVVPLVMGSLQQLPAQALPGTNPARTAVVSLIARRSVGRPGVRHWRRGANLQGDVANFVETEQLIEVGGDGPPVVSSFVVVRGSIPLLWSQIPNIKYKPTTLIAPLQTSDAPFDRHVRELIEKYKEVTAINLSNAHGSEGKLGQAYLAENDRFGKAGRGLRLFPFDFHAICGSTRYERMSELWQEIMQDFERYGFFLEVKGSQEKRQQGIFRVNCIDCLDRTNVVQGYLARHQMETVLKLLGCLPPTGSLPVDMPKLEARFKGMWANHGDEISRQYAGTGALKSGFTRTGKRTFGGKLDDGYKSLMRYYLNNFQDGKKQDALDLITGTYRIDRDKPSPFHFQASPAILISIVLATVALALRGVGLLLTGNVSGDGVSAVLAALLQQVVLPILAAGVILALVVSDGELYLWLCLKLVDEPR